MGEIRRKALVPNANTTEAEAIRRRTVCYTCRERILTGQDTVTVCVEGKDRQYHAWCYDKADDRSM